jgi:hypothetical protein
MVLVYCFLHGCLTFGNLICSPRVEFGGGYVLIRIPTSIAPAASRGYCRDTTPRHLYWLYLTVVLSVVLVYWLCAFLGSFEYFIDAEARCN